MKLLNLFIVLSHASLAFAQASGPTPRHQQPGYLHGKKALEYEGELKRGQADPQVNTVTEEQHQSSLKRIQALERKMLLEQQKTFASYQHTPRNQVDLRLLDAVFDSHFRKCMQEPEKFRCDESLKEAMAVYRNLERGTGNNARSLSRERQVADFFFAKRNYQEAHQIYILHYWIVSKQFCSEKHIDLLRRLLTSQLNLEKQSEFRRYWEIAKKCEATGYLRANGLHFVHYDSKKEVHLQALLKK